MELSNQPAPVLDQRFFHITGIAMVVATLVAGAIMVWLANDVGTTEKPVLITANVVSPTTALQEPVTFAAPVNEVNFRINSNEMVSSFR
jgi:hypothetical protein